MATPIESMTPEQRAEYEALLAETERVRAAEGLSPPVQAPVPDRPVPAPGTEVVPPDFSDRPRAALPPLPSLPQSETGEINMSRPKLRALKALSAISEGMFGGPNAYQQRLKQEQIEADRRNKANMRDYQMELQQRQQQRNEQLEGAPIPESLAAPLGIEGMTAGEAQRLSPLIGAKTSAQQARELAELRGEQALGMEGVQQEGRLDLQRLRNQGSLAAARDKARGVAGTTTTNLGAGLDQNLARKANMTLEEFQDAKDDIARGIETSKGALKLYQAASVDSDVGRFLTRLSSIASRSRQYTEKSQDEISDAISKAGDTRSTLATWDEYAKDNAGKLQGYLKDIQSFGYPHASSEAKAMVRAMRPPIAAFLKEMAGTAMSPSEVGMHTGPAAMVLTSNNGGDWASFKGIGEKLQSYLAMQGASIEDIFSNIERIRGRMEERIQAKVRTAPMTALDALPPDLEQKEVVGRFREAVAKDRVSIPEGYKILPSSIDRDGYKIRYKIFKPGTGEPPETRVWKAD